MKTFDFRLRMQLIINNRRIACGAMWITNNFNSAASKTEALLLNLHVYRTEIAADCRRSMSSSNATNNRQFRGVVVGGENCACHEMTLQLNILTCDFTQNLRLFNLFN